MVSARASGLSDILRTAAESTTDIIKALLEDSSFQYAGPIISSCGLYHGRLFAVGEVREIEYRRREA
jgi:hypothetical protein